MFMFPLKNLARKGLKHVYEDSGFVVIPKEWLHMTKIGLVGDVAA